MNVKKNLAVTILLIGFGMNAQNEDSVRIDNLENKIKYLEEYKSNIESVYKIELDKAIKTYDKDFNEKYSNIRDYAYVLSFLIIFSGLWGAYLWFYGIKKKADQQINNRIEDIVERKREDIINLIQSQEFKSKLKQNKKLLVISDNEEGQKEIKKIIGSFNFKNIVYRINESYKNLPDHDLIIINNIDGEFKQKQINNLLEKVENEDIYFVVYTMKQLDRNPRLNFANSKFTLYNNIFNTLSYSETLNS